MNLAIWNRLLNTRYGPFLGLNIVLQGCLIGILAPLIPILIVEKIGLDKSGVMIFFLLNTLVGIAVTLGTGWLSDGTIARYKLVLVCGLVATLGFAGLSQATSAVQAWLSGIAIACMGVGFPQVFAVAKTGLVAGWEHEAQVMGITALRTLYSLGFIIGTALTSLLISADIRTVFVLITVVAAVVTVSTTLLLYRIENHILREAVRINESNSAASSATTGYALPMWTLIIPLLALTIMRGADSTRGVYLPLVMFQMFKDASIAPLMFGITATAELIVMGMMGYLSSKIGEKATISIGALVGALYFAIMSFSQSLPFLYFAHVFYAVFVAALLGVAMAYIQGLMAHRAGLGGSLFMMVFNVGALIGILSPLLVTGYDQTIFVIPTILCVIGAGLLMFGDRTAQIQKRLQAAAVMVDSQEVLIAKQ